MKPQVVERNTTHQKLDKLYNNKTDFIYTLGDNYSTYHHSKDRAHLDVLNVSRELWSVILKSIYQNQTVSPWYHIGITSVSPRYHLGITSVSPRYHLGITSVSPRYHLGITSVYHLGISPRYITSVYHLGITSVSPRYHLGITSVSPRYHLGITSVSPQYHLSITSVSPRYHLVNLTSCGAKVGTGPCWVIVTLGAGLPKM